MYASTNDWGLYSNVKFDMAELLRKEMKLREALHILLEIFYLDLNGPNNLGGMGQYPGEYLKPFDPKNGYIAPGILDRICAIFYVCHVAINEIREILFRVAQELFEKLKLPVSPDKAWDVLEKELLEEFKENK